MTRGGPVSSCCPMDRVLRIIMGQWSTYILWILQNHDVLRFGEIRALIPDISAKVLTERLRHLESAGLVHRDYRPTIPPAVSYSLTARGHELKVALATIHDIALRWEIEDGGTPVGIEPVAASGDARDAGRKPAHGLTGR